jgi:hypothetical protein
MPFTPFHLGPGILLGLFLLNKLDFPTFVAANVIIDWRATLVFFGILDGPLHGWVHTYLGSALMAAVLGSVMIYVRPLLNDALREMEIIEEISVQKILIAAFSGTFLHVTLDTIHHPFMQTFTPLEIRPLYGLASTFELRILTFGCLILSFPVYLLHTGENIDEIIQRSS